MLTRRRPHGAGHIANSLADRARTSNAADRSQSMPAAMLGRWATRLSPCSCWTVGCSRAACELRGADVAATCHVTMTSPPESRPFASPSPSIPDPRTGHGGGPPSGRWRSAGHHDARVATLLFTRNRVGLGRRVGRSDAGSSSDGGETLRRFASEADRLRGQTPRRSAADAESVSVGPLRRSASAPFRLASAAGRGAPPLSLSVEPRRAPRSRLLGQRRRREAGGMLA